jgi:hypothetical protein|tara:strand:- start:61 stop:171 length:111 start_codon:yes stop_codon:yes gene_type:complete
MALYGRFFFAHCYFDTGKRIRFNRDYSPIGEWRVAG